MVTLPLARPWNYRVLKHGDGDTYAIHEVYYEHPRGTVEGPVPHSCTENPVAPLGEGSPEDLRRDMEMMLRAFDYPVLNYDDFGSHEPLG